MPSPRDMNSSSPPTHSLAVKLATLLFSGSVASLAIVHGASSGCDSAPAAGREAEPRREPDRAAEAREPAPAPAPPAELAPALPAPGAVTPGPAPADAGAPRYFGGSKSDDDAWGVGGIGASELMRYYGGNEADLDAPRPPPPKKSAKPKRGDK